MKRSQESTKLYKDDAVSSTRGLDEAEVKIQGKTWKWDGVLQKKSGPAEGNRGVGDG